MFRELRLLCPKSKKSYLKEVNNIQEVTVIGDINVDISGKFSTWPRRGSCSFSSNPTISPGGVGGNVAVALKRLGINVKFISAVGNDIFGSFYVEQIEKEGIDTSLIQVLASYNTGLVFTIIDDCGERTFLAFRLNSADIHMNLKSQLLVRKVKEPIFISGVVIAEGVEAYTTTLNLLKEKRNQKIFLDPSVRTLNGKINSLMCDKYYEALKFTNVFLPNEEELLEITRKTSISEALSKIFKFGVEEVWVKRGPNDIIYASKDGQEEKYPVVSVHKVVDTTGAGDAFDAAIIYGYIKGWAPYKKASFAAKVAAYSIQRLGSIPSFPKISQLLKTRSC
jgi:ribokinase